MTKSTGVGRGGRRPGAGRPRNPPHPDVLQALEAIRRVLEQQNIYLGRQLSEKLDRLLRAQVETRRQLGQTELHVAPRHTRRRPLGAD